MYRHTVFSFTLVASPTVMSNFRSRRAVHDFTADPHTNDDIYGVPMNLGEPHHWQHVPLGKKSPTEHTLLLVVFLLVVAIVVALFVVIGMNS